MQRITENTLSPAPNSSYSVICDFANTWMQDISDEDAQVLCAFSDHLEINSPKQEDRALFFRMLECSIYFCWFEDETGSKMKDWVKRFESEPRSVLLEVLKASSELSLQFATR